MFEEVDSLLGDLTDIRKNLSSTDANATVLSARLDSTLSDLEDIKANLTAALKDLDAGAGQAIQRRPDLSGPRRCRDRRGSDRDRPVRLDA